MPYSGSCPKCALLFEQYEQTAKTPRDYWVMTELFVMIHGGDTCPPTKPTPPPLREIKMDGTEVKHAASPSA